MKVTTKQRYEIKLHDGTVMIPGQGNVPTSHEGVPPKDFAKELARVSKAASDAEVFDSEKEAYASTNFAATR